MDREREEKIRSRAYQIWQREGQPAGRDQDHWYRAQSEVSKDEQSAAAPAAAEPAAEVPPTLSEATAAAGKSASRPKPAAKAPRRRNKS